MALAQAFLAAEVMHARHAPKKHLLNYKVWYLCMPLSALSALDGLRWLSRRGFNVLQLRDQDYGTGKQTLSAWIDDIKAKHQVVAGGETLLITMPRMLGYGFNPVSFWLMQDSDKKLRAVLAEVNNTFGERHCYLCRHPDGREILPTDWLQAEKVFHVSPFMKVSGTYDFAFAITDEQVDIRINHSDGGQRLLTTGLKGQRRPLNDRVLLGAFFRYPLLTFKVIALIHWHALRLVLKGIRYNVKPKPPSHMVSS